MKEKDAAVQTKRSVTSEIAEEGNVDKIRDILFGSQMRDYERRFVRLEERLMKEAADLRTETGKRLDALENFIKEELESLSNRITGEQNSRSENLQRLNDGIRDVSQNFDRQVSQLTEQTTKKNSEMRQQLLDQSKNLNDEIQRRHNEVLSTLERESSEIRDDKTDRTMLAQLFQEVALRLTNDFKLPKSE